MPAPGPWRSRLAPWALALVLLASFFVASCSPGLETPDFRGRPAQNVTIPVDVRNQHYSDIVVRVSRGGAWQRIGDVTGNSSERLEIPAAMTGPTGDYQFRVHAIGTPDDADYVSERISAYPGTVIVLTVAPVLRMSSWTIRN